MNNVFVIIFYYIIHDEKIFIYIDHLFIFTVIYPFCFYISFSFFFLSQITCRVSVVLKESCRVIGSVIRFPRILDRFWSTPSCVFYESRRNVTNYVNNDRSVHITQPDSSAPVQLIRQPHVSCDTWSTCFLRAYRNIFALDN